MRRFPFFVAPLLGIVALFFLFKVLFVALAGLAVFAMAFMAARALSGRRFHPMQEAGLSHLRPMPIDVRYSEPEFHRWAAQSRIIEIV